MDKMRALHALRAARRIVAKLSVIALIACSMATLVASAEPKEITADQFLREAMAASTGRNEFPSMTLRVTAVAQQCCKAFATRKACGDTCIARDQACRRAEVCV